MYNKIPNAKYKIKCKMGGNATPQAALHLPGNDSDAQMPEGAARYCDRRATHTYKHTHTGQEEHAGHDAKTTHKIRQIDRI